MGSREMTALPYTKTTRMPAETSIADERRLVFLYPFQVLGMHKIGSPWQEMVRNQIGRTTLTASNGNWQSCLPGSRSVGVLFHVEVFLRTATKYKKGKSERQKTQKFRFKASAKRSQHANPAYRNIVGRSMLYAFGDPVATR